MKYSVGSLVKARGREWVVLPESDNDLLMVRPLGGSEEEVTGIFLPLEKVEPASFALPDPTHPGDFRSSRLLREAVRLGFRSSAGPFRSFARLGVDPRPYQLVPLLLALRQDPVRLLIADDVGVGKTIEAGLIARELIDRGEIKRLAVLCPPQLAEQWQSELSAKFHIEAELVLSSTVNRLEKNCRLGQSLFEVYPYVIVSTDFIKSDRHREDFQRACPEFVIVDEAHTCAYSGDGKGGRHQRHQLILRLAQNPDRHLLLVTATPHSGNEAAFRSLLGLLDKDFATLPEDISREEYQAMRQRLSTHMVQRRRADIRHFLQASTPFPERLEKDETFKLSPEYKKLFEKVLRYAREMMHETATSQHRQRVRWWSVLALLRSMGSSPMAAAATLRNRANTAATETVEEADELGRRSVLDMVDDQSGEGLDLIPGSDFEDESAGEETKNRRRLLEMAREAEALVGEKDEKLKKALKLVKELVTEGYNPIVFCRYIPTAEYMATALRSSLPKDVEVAAITGLLPPSEREERVEQLATSPRRVLVATDCLSEGINLQEYFNAILHYDLSWNPTRHEQREGRVDRYGQPTKDVKVITYYGTDNQIDGVVLEVLLQKYKRIRKELGISVPVPVDTDKIIEAIFEGLLLKESNKKPNLSDALQLTFDFGDEFSPERKMRDGLYKDWERSADREKRSRTIFAQGSIKVDEVASELEAVQGAIGAGVEVERFVRDALKAHGAFVNATRGTYEINLSETPRTLREMLDNRDKFKARFELPVNAGEVHLSRTHPLVEGLATYVMDTALDPLGQGIARRCGVIRTKQVKTGTTLLLLRFRYHIITRKLGVDYPLLAEDCQLVAFTGSPQNPTWLEGNSTEALLDATSDVNVLPDQAANFLQRVIDQYENLRPHLEEVAKTRGDELLEAHRRVRSAAKVRGQQQRVEAQLPPDILGIYIYLPT